VLLAAAEAMAGRLQDIAAQQQSVLARIQTLNRGTMPMTTAGIHADLVRLPWRDQWNAMVLICC